MNTYRYDEEKRKQWVRDKVSRAKTVRQICREASISRATLYNWLDEFRYLEQEFSSQRERRDKDLQAPAKASKPELLARTSPETAERYRMLVAALTGLDTDKSLSKKLVAVLIKRFTLTVPQACAIVGLDEESYGYKPRKPEVEDYIVYEGLVNLIREDRTRDFETCYELLIKRNPDWTRKQIKRVYRDGMVYLERKRSNLRWEIAGKAKAGSMPVEPVLVLPELQKNRISKPGGTWSMGLLEYISELDGVKQPWWMLCILDEETGLPLNGTFGLGTISTDDLLSFLEKAAAENGLPKKLKVPGKPALSVRELTRWVWEHRMALHTFSLNKPENQEAINRMEATVLQSLGIEAITSTHGLAEAIERWIAKEVVA